MPTPNNIQPLQKGSPVGMRSTEVANDVIAKINQLRTMKVRIANGASSLTCSEADCVLTISIDEIITQLRQRGVID